MDVTEENMIQKEMLEKIAEQNYSLNQKKDLIAKMRHWQDVADDEMAVLRSENTTLRKEVKALEKVISEAQKVEAEPCKGLLADDLGVKTCRGKKIHEFEKEATMMKKQNKKLTEELKILQQEKEHTHVSFCKCRVSLQDISCGLEEAQLGLQNRDEVIYQKNLQIKHLEESVEEFSHAIEYFRLTNTELKEQLEARLDEASLTSGNDRMGDGEGFSSPPLSFAEEIKLLNSSAEVETSVETSVSDSTDLRHEETEAEELLKPQSCTLDLQTKRCAGILEAAVLRAGLFLVFVVVLSVLVLVPPRSCPGNLCPINTLQSFVRLILKPYCSLHHGARTPI